MDCNGGLITILGQDSGLSTKVPWGWETCSERLHCVPSSLEACGVYPLGTFGGPPLCDQLWCSLISLLTEGAGVRTLPCLDHQMHRFSLESPRFLVGKMAQIEI